MDFPDPVSRSDETNQAPVGANERGHRYLGAETASRVGKFLSHRTVILRYLGGRKVNPSHERMPSHASDEWPTSD
jgi:hypothetical protein